MSQIQNGLTPPWADGDICTAAKLNQMIDSAILNPEAVSSQTLLSTVATGNEMVLIYDPVSTGLRKTPFKEVLNSGNDLVTGNIGNPSGAVNVSAWTEVVLNAPHIKLDNHSTSGASIDILTHSGITFSTNTLGMSFNAPSGTITFMSPVVFSSTTNLFPSGVVMIFANTVVPSGWLECNGQAISRTASQYVSLFAAIGTTYGVGDGVNTFNVPDLRGEFVRGWDNGRGIDTSRAIGSSQDQQLEKHKHISSNNDCQNYSAINGIGTGAYNTWCDTNGVYNNGGASLTGDGTHIEQTAKLGTETRPRNVAMMYCIKL